jgi:hypothetical protein
VAYPKYFDQKKLKTPNAWQQRGCPSSYTKAYEHLYWRKRIQDTIAQFKFRYGKELGLPLPSSPSLEGKSLT